MRRIEDEFQGKVRFVWKSFLLRPRPPAWKSFDEFREYTKKWLRPAADENAGTFRVWSTEEGPPSHSIPAHLVAKAAAALGDDASRRMHDRLLHAYFAENRDISSPRVLRELWDELDLPADGFACAASPQTLEEVLADHREAEEHEVDGVPAVRLEGNPIATMGAHPLEAYRGWVEKLLAAREER